MVPLADARRLMAAFLSPAKPSSTGTPSAPLNEKGLARLSTLLEEAKMEQPALRVLQQPDNAAPKEVDITEVYEAAQRARSAALDRSKQEIEKEIGSEMVAGNEGFELYKRRHGHMPGEGSESADDETAKVLEQLVRQMTGAVGESHVRTVLMLAPYCTDDDTMRSVVKAGAVRSTSMYLPSIQLHIHCAAFPLP